MVEVIPIFRQRSIPRWTLLPFACYLESNPGVDRLPVDRVPFDQDISLTKELAELYGARQVKRDSKSVSRRKAIVGAR